MSKNVYNRVQACEYLQRRIARTLLEKLGTLGLAASKADDPYTADLMAKDLVAWFEERLRSREPLTDHVRNLQQSLLKSTVAAANVKDKPSSGSGSAFALFDGSGSLSDGGDLFPATDAGALPDMPAERRADDFTPLGAGEVQGAAYGYRTPRVIPAFREHLFYGLLLDMKAMYRRGAASAPWPIRAVSAATWPTGSTGSWRSNDADKQAGCNREVAACLFVPGAISAFGRELRSVRIACFARLRSISGGFRPIFRLMCGSGAPCG